MIEIDENEYAPTINDDDEMLKIKQALIDGLRPVERRIFLTYAETGTFSATAKEFHVSVPTAKKYLLEVRNKILKYIEDNDDSNSNTIIN